MSVIKLQTDANKKLLCPKCGQQLRTVAGGSISVKNGRVDLDATLPRQVCDTCGVFYRELLHSGYYHVYDLPENERQQKKSAKVIATGDIPPTILKREADGKCPCPRCGERMDFVEGGAVQIVNGKPDFSNTMDHFVCAGCNSVFRKIVGTDYFQWSER